MLGNVLIIESAPRLAEPLAAQLRLAKLSVQVAASAHSARQHMGKSAPDAIIMNTDLADGCGFELSSYFAGLRKLAHMPIFLYAKAPASPDHAQALASGAIALMSLPLDIELLKFRLPALIRGRRVMAELDLHLPSETAFNLAEDMSAFHPKEASPAFTSVGLDHHTTKLLTGQLGLIQKSGAECAIVGSLDALADYIAKNGYANAPPAILLCKNLNEPLFKEALLLGAKDAIDLDRSLASLPSAIRYHTALYASQKRKKEEVQNRILDAHVDIMSGAYSRSYAERYLARMGANPNLQGRFGLILIDLDRFKAVNDTFGHNSGDAMIRETVAAIKNTLRADSLLFRWGGDEFLITCLDIDGAGLAALGLRLIEAVSDIALPDGSKLSASFGAASARSKEWSALDLLAEADRSLYQIKALRGPQGSAA